MATTSTIADEIRELIRLFDRDWPEGPRTPGFEAFLKGLVWAGRANTAVVLQKAIRIPAIKKAIATQAASLMKGVSAPDGPAITLWRTIAHRLARLATKAPRKPEVNSLWGTSGLSCIDEYAGPMFTQETEWLYDKNGAPNGVQRGCRCTFQRSWRGIASELAREMDSPLFVGADFLSIKHLPLFSWATDDHMEDRSSPNRRFPYPVLGDFVAAAVMNRLANARRFLDLLAERCGIELPNRECLDDQMAEVQCKTWTPPEAASRQSAIATLQLAILAPRPPVNIKSILPVEVAKADVKEAVEDLQPRVLEGGMESVGIVQSSLRWLLHVLGERPDGPRSPEILSSSEQTTGAKGAKHTTGKGHKKSRWPKKEWFTVTRAARELMKRVETDSNGEDLTLEKARALVSADASRKKFTWEGKGRKRRIEPDSLSTWILERSAQYLDAQEEQDARAEAIGQDRHQDSDDSEE